MLVVTNTLDEQAASIFGINFNLEDLPGLGSTSKTTLSHNPEQQNLKKCHHESVKTQEC